MVVELEAQPQQQPALEDAARDRRVADRAEQDRVVAADLLEDGVRERLTGAVPACGTQVVVGAVERDVVASGDGVQDLETLGDDLRADAVSGDDGEPVRVGHAPRVRGRLRYW